MYIILPAWSQAQGAARNRGGRTKKKRERKRLQGRSKTPLINASSPFGQGSLGCPRQLRRLSPAMHISGPSSHSRPQLPLARSPAQVHEMQVGYDVPFLASSAPSRYCGDETSFGIKIGSSRPASLLRKVFELGAPFVVYIKISEPPPYKPSDEPSPSLPSCMNLESSLACFSCASVIPGCFIQSLVCHLLSEVIPHARSDSLEHPTDRPLHTVKISFTSESPFHPIRPSILHIIPPEVIF